MRCAMLSVSSHASIIGQVGQAAIVHNSYAIAETGMRFSQTMLWPVMHTLLMIEQAGRESGNQSVCYPSRSSAWSRSSHTPLYCIPEPAGRCLHARTGCHAFPKGACPDAILRAEGEHLTAAIHGI